MSDPIQTTDPDQLPQATTADPGLRVLIQMPDGTLQTLAWDVLLGKLLTTDLIKTEESDLQADLAHDENEVALVTADPDAAKSGWYRKTGASGAGEWVQFEKLGAQALAEVEAVIQQAIDAKDAAEAAAADAGGGSDTFDTIINRRIRRARLRRSKGTRGLIYISDGQSLGRRRDYSGGAVKVTRVSPNAMMFAGGVETISMAGVSNITTDIADGSNFESLVDFALDADEAGKVDGWAAMCDRPTVHVITSRGSTDYLNWRDGSSIHTMFCMAVSQAVKLLRDQGCEQIDVVISNSQGEADTDTSAFGGAPGTAVPTTAVEYIRYRAERYQDVRYYVRLALNDPYYEPLFLSHQMAGPPNEPWRDILLTTNQSSDEEPRCYNLNPCAPYGGGTDNVHPPGESQALQGEAAFMYAQRFLDGDRKLAVVPRDYERVGTTITIPFDMPEEAGELEIRTHEIQGEDPNMTDASGFQASGAKCVYGVEVLIDGDDDADRVDIASVTGVGTTLVVELAAVPGAPASEYVRIGLMTAPPGLTGPPAAVPRANICGNAGARRSRINPDYYHRYWALHTRIERAG